MMRTSYEGVTDPSVPRPVLHLVTDLDGKHVDGHNRLRMETEAVEKRLEALERQNAEHAESLKNAAKRTTDIQQLRFTPAMFAATVLLCASIIGGSYASTWSLRDNQASMAKDISLIMASQASQEELRKAAIKLEDQRYSQFADAIKEIKQRGEMTDLKVNNLRETVLTRGK